MSKIDFEKYRQPWETGPHWELKREFLERYQSDFPEDRLLCLAQAYSNIELLHCSYPEPVMREIAQLSYHLKGCRKFRELDAKLEKERNDKPELQAKKAGKRTSNYDASCKPFKYIKFCLSSKVSSELCKISEELNKDSQESNQIIIKPNNEQSNNRCVEESNKTIQESSKIIVKPDNEQSNKNIEKLNIDIQESKKNLKDSNKSANSITTNDLIKNPTSSKSDDKCEGTKDINYIFSLLKSADFDNIKKIAAAMPHKSRFGLESAIQLTGSENIVKFSFVPESSSVHCCQIYVGNTLLSIGRDAKEWTARKNALDYASSIFSNLSKLPCKTLNCIRQKLHRWKSISNHQKLLSKVISCTDLSLKIEALDEVLSQMKNDPDYEDLHLILDVIKNLLKLPDDKSLTPFDKIQLATEKLRCAGLASFFNFSEDPYTLLHLRLYHCDFVIGNIFICRAKAHNKKKATFEAAQQGYFCFYNLLENNELETLENAHEETQVLETDDISSKELKLNVVVDKNIENSSAKTDALPTYLENNSASSRSEHPSSQFHEFTVNRHIISSNTTISKDANLSLNSECNVQRFNKWKSIKKGFKVNEELLKNSLEKEMVVFDKAESDITLSSAAILNMSATKCHKKLTVHFNLEDNNSICCHYYLDNEEIGTGCAFLKQEAKLTAALNARRNLEKQFYTILIKNDIEDPIFVSREQIRVLEAKSLGVLSENNIGFKMMKTMGWAGGGIGKNSGRTEPIIVDQHSYNQGLGFSIGKTEKTAMKTKDFKQKVETVLREYSACNSKSDLVFSADFDKEERKMIHKLTEKYPNLQSSSYGKNEGRQLRIKRKSKGIEILKELLQAEGSTNRYELIDKSN